MAYYNPYGNYNQPVQQPYQQPILQRMADDHFIAMQDKINDLQTQNNFLRWDASQGAQTADLTATILSRGCCGYNM